MLRTSLLLAGCCTLMAAQPAYAATPDTEAVTLANVAEPSDNSSDEPLAREFSVARAKHFLDSASLTWQKQHDCMTCHTNYLYMLARPALGPADEAQRTVRKYADDMVTDRWTKQGPRWDAEVVMTALVLAADDAALDGKLRPTTRTALDRMRSVQKEHGGFEWIRCDWPPFENDHEFGATMAALAFSVAPENYADSAEVQPNLERLRKYLETTPMPTLHHRLMLLWADTYRPGWLKGEVRSEVLNALLAPQHADGGWSAAAFGDWKRADGSPQDVQTSDGYGTGLAIYLARRAGVRADDARLVRGVAWLKSHQRESGRWFTRSLHQDSRHYLTHAGTSMAVMALAACDQLR